jgi:hypothetical protein
LPPDLAYPAIKHLVDNIDLESMLINVESVEDGRYVYDLELNRSFTVRLIEGGIFFENYERQLSRVEPGRKVWSIGLL